jgi:hypothetical protein
MTQLQVYVVNLSSRHDRRNEILRELGHLRWHDDLFLAQRPIYEFLPLAVLRNSDLNFGERTCANMTV